MTPSAYFSGTVPSRENNCTEAVVVSRWMLHNAHAHSTATSLLLLPEAFMGEKVSYRCRTNVHDWGFYPGYCTTSANVKVTQDCRLFSTN